MRRIYARKTTVKQIDDKIADDFIDKYHDQGLVVFGKSRYNLGLFYNEELIGVVSFSNPRTRAKSRKYQHELVRMAFKTDTRVVGGASKMIKHYIDVAKPKNFFTYQTLSGEQTNVYAHAGMTLVEKGTTKQVLVKNGYTYETALQADEKYLYLNNQLVNLGPDNILKTKLGEVFENDKRLTNEELFLRFCDYHKETILGDNVYEYNNPKYYHYIYKITNNNPEDNHYYLGRHSVYSEKPLTTDDFLTDRYFGSGGKLFQDWKQETLNAGYELVKEIVSTQETLTDNLKAESKIIGDKHIHDYNCLNAIEGGLMATDTARLVSSQQHCEIHGLATFQGKKCCRCTSEKSYSQKPCDKHGLTTFQGDHCCKCGEEANKHRQYCSKCNKETTWRANTCMGCVNTNVYTVKYCETHGNTKHRSNTCMKCVSDKKPKKPKKEKITEKKYCAICNKESRHVDNACMSCKEQALYKMLDCPKHGHTKHRGKTCCKCRSEEMKRRRLEKKSNKENKK